MPERSIKGKERDVKGKGKEKAIGPMAAEEKSKNVETVADGQMMKKRQFARRRRIIREDSDEEEAVPEKAQIPERTSKVCHSYLQLIFQ